MKDERYKSYLMMSILVVMCNERAIVLNFFGLFVCETGFMLQICLLLFRCLTKYYDANTSMVVKLNNDIF